MRHVVLLLSGVLAACGSDNPENSAVCGFASMAGATMVLEEMRAGTKALYEVPDGLEGTVPARVAGHGSGRALVAHGADGLVLGFEGDGFPTRPGFGLLLVEDSLDTFKGVLIYDLDPPLDYPMLGSISSPSLTLPLYGVRVAWRRVSNERCPLFRGDSGIVG